MIARTGRFLTFCGGAPIDRPAHAADPAERIAMKLVRETDAGIVVRGKIGMHTSPAFAEDVYVGALRGSKSMDIPRDLYRAGQCARRHDFVPQDRGAR